MIEALSPISFAKAHTLLKMSGDLFVEVLGEVSAHAGDPSRKARITALARLRLVLLDHAGMLYQICISLFISFFLFFILIPKHFDFSIPTSSVTNGADTELFEAVSDVLFPTVFLYSDRPSIHAAFNAVKALLANPEATILPYFTATLAATTARYTRGSPEHGLRALRTLASWTLLVLRDAKPSPASVEWSNTVRLSLLCSLKV